MHAWYSKQQKMNSWDQALCIHPAWVLNANWDSQAQAGKTEEIARNICLPSTHALSLSTARQLALQLAFGVVRAKLLLYLNNTASARTCLQLLDRFWCGRALNPALHAANTS